MMILKIGGGKDINIDFIAQDLKVMKIPMIIVHGANHAMQNVSQKMGLEEQMLTSPSGFTSRYTDQATLDVLTMVYAGATNKKIVAKLISYGINAIGLSGIDGRLWQAKRKKSIEAVINGKTKLISDSLTGRVVNINTELMRLLLSHGYCPVVTIPAISEENEIVNVDSDLAVAKMAQALAVKQLIFLFETPGLLTDINNESSLVKTVHLRKLESYYPVAGGRMKKKLLAAKEALEGGVETIYFGDGRIEHPIQAVTSGGGTTIYR